MRAHFKFFCLLTIGMLILSACNMAEDNATAESSQQSPTSPPVKLTATPTLTALPSDTPTETSTATPTLKPSATLTPEPPIAEVMRESNCRIGPGGVYNLVATYQAGQLLDVVAKDLGGGYWFVKNREKPEEQCYLLGQNITITGDTSALPQFTPQPSPTAAPYFEASLKKLDSCNGLDFVIFTIENTGSVAFRSVYIKVTDQKTGKSVEQVLNAFDLFVKCTLAKNIAPLNPGGIGYAAAPPFTWNARGNKLNVVLMLCTEKALQGTCITRVIEAKAE